MKIAIIDTSDVMPKTTTNVHLTNCIIIKDYLKRHDINCRLYVSSDEMPKVTDYTHIILSYGSKYFNFKKWSEFIERQESATTIWMTNDYDLEPNSSLKKYVTHLITNHSRKRVKSWSSKIECVVNLNCLIVNDSAYENLAKYDAVYYGTFRKDRLNYFEKYLSDKKVIISTNEKNKKKFKNIGCKASYINKMNWLKNKETLRLFRYSLYVEDNKTHNWYSHLANRFYESLSCWSLPIIDENCANSFRESIFNMSDFPIIKNTQDISDLNIDEESRIKIIRKNLAIAIDEKIETLRKIKDFLQELK